MVSSYPIDPIKKNKNIIAKDAKDKVKFHAEHIALLNIDTIYFELEQYKCERSWYNLNIDKDGIRSLLSDNTWYTLYLPKTRLKFKNFDDVLLIQQIATELLKRFCDHFYNYCKRSFIEPCLELRELTSEDDNIPEDNYYQLIVDGNEEQVMVDIEEVMNYFEKRKASLRDVGNLQFCRFGIHLFEPLFYVRKGSKIILHPVTLNESEFQFITDLKKWAEKNEIQLQNKSIELFLLRNLSRGKGIGFFEAGNFHPDFILWMIVDNRQYVTFIEPHGMLHEGIASEKVRFHKRIKDIEAHLRIPNIILNSFILSWTESPKLFLDENKKKEFEANNVLFMTDDRDVYIDKMFDKIKGHQWI